jgi:dolichol-phosphate mannosyltransferase
MRNGSETTITPQVSLVIPTYNERENIEAILRATVQSLEKQRSYEVIVVDDDSPDRTWAIVEGFAATSPSIRLVRRTLERKDQAQAILAGFRTSRGAIVGKMDADGSHDPGALPQLLAAIDAGFEVAIGSRYVNGGAVASWPLRRRVLSRMATGIVRTTMHLDIADPLSGFWLMRREIFERAATYPASGGFKVLLQLCVRGQARKIAEVPIQFRDRIRGKSKLRPMVLVQSMVSLVSLAAESVHRRAKGTLENE